MYLLVPNVKLLGVSFLSTFSFCVSNAGYVDHILWGSLATTKLITISEQRTLSKENCLITLLSHYQICHCQICRNILINWEFKLVHFIVPVMVINPIIRFLLSALGVPFPFSSLAGIFYFADMLPLCNYGGSYSEPSKMLNKN